MGNEQAHREPKPNDIIEIVESHYVPTLPIGAKYVVIESFDGYDVSIINEHGQYDTVCWEDYKIIGNVSEAKERYMQRVIDIRSKFSNDES